MLDEEGPSRIDLTWTPPAATGGGAITGYKIEYSNSSSGTPAANSWRVLVANLNKTEDEVEGVDGTQITYTDDGSVAMLQEGNRRYYRVSAINSAGAGMPFTSERSEVTPAAANVPTSAPTGLKAMAMGPTQIDLSWTAPTDTSGDEITGYKIESATLIADGSSPPFTGTVLVANTGNDKTTYTDKSLTMAETTRQYRVSAIIAVADNLLTSVPSNVAIATTAKATVS